MARLLGLGAVIGLAVTTGLAWVALPAGASPPTKASWAHAANVVCGRGDAEIRELPKFSAENLIADIRATVQIATAADTKMNSIPQPSSERLAIRKLLSNGASQNKLAAQALVQLEHGEKDAALSLLKRVSALGDVYNRMATALGAAVCAENPTPSAPDSPKAILTT